MPESNSKPRIATTNSCHLGNKEFIMSKIRRLCAGTISYNPDRGGILCQSLRQGNSTEDKPKLLHRIHSKVKNGFNKDGELLFRHRCQTCGTFN